MNKIKYLRTERGWTQERLGKELNVKGAAISKYESGSIPLTDESIKKLCKIFDVSSDYLLSKSDIRNPYKEDKTLSTKDEKDIARDLENTLGRLEDAQDGLMFDGEALDDETRELLKISLENSMRLAKQIAKKYTPNKYKK